MVCSRLYVLSVVKMVSWMLLLPNCDLNSSISSDVKPLLLCYSLNVLLGCVAGSFQVWCKCSHSSSRYLKMLGGCESITLKTSIIVFGAELILKVLYNARWFTSSFAKFMYSASCNGWPSGSVVPLISFMCDPTPCQNNESVSSVPNKFRISEITGGLPRRQFLGS